jgi:hypothetical protein
LPREFGSRFGRRETIPRMRICSVNAEWMND